MVASLEFVAGEDVHHGYDEHAEAGGYENRVKHGAVSLRTGAVRGRRTAPSLSEVNDDVGCKLDRDESVGGNSRISVAVKGGRMEGVPIGNLRTELDLRRH